MGPCAMHIGELSAIWHMQQGSSAHATASQIIVCVQSLLLLPAVAVWMKVTVLESTFTGNHASESGAASYVADTAQAIVVSSQYGIVLS